MANKAEITTGGNSFTLNGVQSNKGTLTVFYQGNKVSINGNLYSLPDVTIDGTAYTTTTDLRTALDLKVFRKGGGNGGGVAGVTGDLVNNTDPINPVVNLPDWVNYLRADRIGYANLSNNNTYSLGSTYVDATGIISSSSPTGLTNITLNFPAITSQPVKRHMLIFLVDVAMINITQAVGVNVLNILTEAKKNDIWTLTYDQSAKNWHLEAINSVPRWWIEKYSLSKEEFSAISGWAVYNDNLRTSGAPLVIASGSRVKVTNNANTVINDQLPVGVTSFWDSVNNKITPNKVGDSYMVNLRFTAVSDSNQGLADIEIDVGGSLGIITGTTISLRKGVGSSQRVNLNFDVYAGTTFLANGGDIYLTSIEGATSIYDIRLKITRVHKGR